jgi:hypothetical protein
MRLALHGINEVTRHFLAYDEVVLLVEDGLVYDIIDRQPVNPSHPLEWISRIDPNLYTNFSFSIDNPAGLLIAIINNMIDEIHRWEIPCGVSLVDIRESLYPLAQGYMGLLSKSRITHVIQTFNITHHACDTLFKKICLLMGVDYISLYTPSIQGFEDFKVPLRETLDGYRSIIKTRIKRSPWQKLRVFDELSYYQESLFKSDFACISGMDKPSINGPSFLNTKAPILPADQYLASKPQIFGISGCYSHQLHDKIAWNRKRIKEAYEYYNKKTVSFPDRISPGSLLIAAHYQPEATVYAESPIIKSHAQMLMALRCLGHRDTIYYKEHPAVFIPVDEKLQQENFSGIYRDVSYYNNLERMGVRFLDPFIPLRTVNNFFEFVATLTGSIAIERSLMGQKTLVLGDPWYGRLPGTDKDLSVLKCCPFGPEQIKLRAIRHLIRILNNALITGHNDFFGESDYAHSQCNILKKHGVISKQSPHGDIRALLDYLKSG